MGCVWGILSGPLAAVKWKAGWTRAGDWQGVGKSLNSQSGFDRQTPKNDFIRISSFERKEGRTKKIKTREGEGDETGDDEKLMDVDERPERLSSTTSGRRMQACSYRKLQIPAYNLPFLFTRMVSLSVGHNPFLGRKQSVATCRVETHHLSLSPSNQKSNLPACI